MLVDATWNNLLRKCLKSGCGAHGISIVDKNACRSMEAVAAVRTHRTTLPCRHPDYPTTAKSVFSATNIGYEMAETVESDGDLDVLLQLCGQLPEVERLGEELRRTETHHALLECLIFNSGQHDDWDVPGKRVCF